MMNSVSTRLFAAAAILAGGLTGCLASASDSAGEETESASTGGILEGTPEALGILRAANELDAMQLGTDVGLSSSVSNNMASYRIGDDELSGTSDDEEFDTLAELDAIPGVGPGSFAKLLAYAMAHGYVPGDDLECSGPVLTSADVIDRFAPGTTSANLGAYRLEGRSRVCTNATGCAEWTTDASSIQPGASLGITTIEVADNAGNVTVSFSRLPTKIWLLQVPLTSQPVASAMGELLVEPESFSYQASPIRRTCAMMKASKTEMIDAIKRKEIEVVLRASHSLEADLAAYFTVPHEIEFQCNTHRWDYQWTCQGFHEYEQPGSGLGTIVVTPQGDSISFQGTQGWASYAGSFNKSYPLDAFGYVNETVESGGSTQASFHAGAVGNVTTVTLSYSWTSSPNFCGASTHLDYQCYGVLIAP